MESITVSEAARRMNVSNHQVDKWIRDGLIECVEMPSGRKRIEPRELARFWQSLPRRRGKNLLELSEVLELPKLDACHGD